MPNGLFLKKNELNNNEDDSESKISKTTIIILVFFGIALVYAIIMIIKINFTKPIIYYKNNIEQYTTSDNILNSDYFYTIDLQVANFLEAVDREMYNELYNIFDSRYKSMYSKNDVINKLKEYKNDVFKYGKVPTYTEHVQNVYVLSDKEYLVQLDFNNNEFYMLITMGMRGYNFAIVE